MELGTVLAIVLCMLFTAYSMHILRYCFMLVCSQDNCASSIELVATSYAEWYPGGWEEGNRRSLRSEEHCALAGHRNLVLKDELPIVKRGTDNPAI